MHIPIWSSCLQINYKWLEEQRKKIGEQLEAKGLVPGTGKFNEVLNRKIQKIKYKGPPCQPVLPKRRYHPSSRRGTTSS